MKIEPLPWLRDYFVDMNDVYTELNLKQIENKAHGEIFITLKDYGDVLIRGSGLNSRNKILMKGDPGMGKTILGKKIGLDWAVGIFRAFSIVFFVALKLVRPQQAIEDAILQQNSELLGLKVSKQKLASILDKFSDRCLLILDGLDEHGLGTNEDVLKIIRDEKLLDSGIVVFSRPHSAKDIEKYFHTIVSVSGFTAGEAEKFVSKIIKDKSRVKEILTFRPVDLTSNVPIKKCPILLAFLCALVNDSDIHLSDVTISVGEIYLRMIRHLYKKFVIRKGADFEEEEFVSMMKSVGKLALKTLTSDKPLLQRGEVLKIVGEYAFEYGFFAGHEDSRLSLDVFSDIYVTYTHRSIEEFFGSFGFLQDLCDGKSVEDILGSDCRKPTFMVNPLALKFCLWFLSNSAIHLSEKDNCYDKLVSYVAKRIDMKHFHPYFVSHQYPAISITRAIEMNDVLELKFFRKALERCKRIRSLSLTFTIPDNYIDYMLGSVSAHVLENLMEITIGGYVHDKKADMDAFRISINTFSYQYLLSHLDIMLSKYSVSRRNPQIYVRLGLRHGSEYDITNMIPYYVKELQLDTKKRQCTLIAAGEFPSCPTLTHLTLSSFQIDSSVSQALTKAVQRGKLPKLTSVKLLGCSLGNSNFPELPEFCFQADSLPGISPNLSLPQHPLKAVTALKLVQIDPDHINDMIAVVRQGLLSNLRELNMSFDVSFDTALKRNMSDWFVREFDPAHAPFLEKLTLGHFITSADQLRTLFCKLAQTKVGYLDLTGSHGVTGSLSVLFANPFPVLHSLVLQDCALNSDDLRSLAQGNVQGKLPQLRHLDISQTNNIAITQDLFSHSAKWDQLLTLATDNTYVLNIGIDKLCSLRELKLPSMESSIKITRSWESIQEIDVFQRDWRHLGDTILSDIADGVEKGLFPNLKTVSCVEMSATTACFRLLRADIEVRLASIWTDKD